ncbi:hypothetical protein RJ639_044064 [Escallonia herrerae]|uniref:RING-type E3 ubiquitin transferase n=1 Tax=Escallonia herrerae TaxID=1293975 RepID=A0AA88WBH0_9ASTE|nr:hypothetical protein RJ639_044064 [Escallonia herrerae]
MVNDEQKHSPQIPKRSSPIQSGPAEINGQKADPIFSPRFRSVVAMAGWDEEALLIASLVVEDTPDRDAKHKKRADLHFKTPPTNSRRKRRAQRSSPASIPAVVLNLDDDESPKKDREENKKELKIDQNEKKMEDGEKHDLNSAVSCSSSAIPCMVRLREELSCAICLEICFEPSTTACGHSNGRSCTVNTVLWNTIQLLFPKEVEARKATGVLNSREAEHESPARASRYSARNRTIEALNSPEGRSHSMERRRRRSSQNMGIRIVRPLHGGVSSSSGDGTTRRRRGELLPVQNEDAALALRLQREEFMVAFRGSDEQHRLARANLRAMATRAMNSRIRNRAT